MNIKNLAAKALFWTFTQRWGRQLINLVIIGIIARFLNPADFGLVALAATVMELATILVNSGFGVVVVQMENITEEHLNTVFWTNILTSIILAIILFLSSGILADFFQEPTLQLIIQVISFDLIISGLISTQISILRRNLKFRIIAIRALLSNLVSGLVGIVLAMNGLGVWSLVFRTLIAGVVDLILLWTVAEWKPKFMFSVTRFQEIYRFSFHVLGSRLLEYVRDNIDNVLIGYFLGVSALGYYSIGFKLIQTFERVINEIFETVALPLFARIKTDFVRFKSVFYQATQTTSVITFVAFIGVLILSEPIITILYGDKWSAAIPIMRWLSLIGIANSLFMFNRAVILSLGYSGWYLISELFDTVLSIVGIIIGIQFGIVEVAMGRTIASVVVIPFVLMFVLRLLQDPIIKYLRSIIPAVIATALMALVLLIINMLFNIQNPFIHVTVYVLLGGFIYLLSLYGLDRSILLRMMEFFKLIFPDKLTKHLK